MAVNEGGQGGVLDQAGQRINPTDDKGQKAAQYVKARTNQHVQPLIKSQELAAQGGQTCYIYNVSHIFEWHRPYAKLGTFTIPKAPKVGDVIVDKKTGKKREATEDDIKGEYKLSSPIVINHSYIASYDKGDNRRVPYVEYGEEISESLVGNSKLYPADLANPTTNLENWGVFICYGKPFEAHSKAEQDKMYMNAMAAHQKRCFEKVLAGDKLHDLSRSGKQASPLEIHRLCALELGEERQWVTQRAPRVKLDMVDCPFCTSSIKATALKCPNCREIVKPDEYAKRVGKKNVEKKEE